MRLLIRDVHLVPGDGSPERPRTDLLIEDGVIAAGSDQPADEVIDGRGLVALPGLVDAHRHVWQAPLRGVSADMTLPDYLGAILDRALSAYTPVDAGAAALLGAAEALDAGVTTVFDWSNSTVSPAHTDAVVDAYLRAGIRAVVAHGRADQPNDVARLAERTGTVTGALTVDGYGGWDRLVDHLALGRRLGVMVSMHTDGRPVRSLDAAGLLGPDLQLVHVNDMTDDDAERLVRSGTAVVVTPVVEGTMGHGASAYGRFHDAGGRAALGTDVVTNSTPDLFEPLRDTLRTERMRTRNKGRMIPAARFLPAATIDGARAAGLEDRVGALTVGRRADVILVDGLAHVAGSDDVSGAVVTALGPTNVRTVIVDGHVVKRDGRLVHHDLATLRDAVTDLARRALHQT